MRIAGGFVAIAGGLLTVESIIAGVRGEFSVPEAAVVALGAAVFTSIGVGYLSRYRLALADDEVTVTNLLRTHRIPLRHVVAARPTQSGIVILLHDGRRIRARAVETSSLSRWLNSYTDADAIADEVKAAAERARGGQPVSAVDSVIVRRNARRSTYGAFARILLLSAVSITVVIWQHLPSQPSANRGSGSASVVKVGDCLNAPAGSTSAAASIVSLNEPKISCSSPHTAQVFSVSDTRTSADCDSSRILTQALPADTHDETIWLVMGGVPSTVCVVITPSITYSVVGNWSP